VRSLIPVTFPAEAVAKQEVYIYVGKGREQGAEALPILPMVINKTANKNFVPSASKNPKPTTPA
jgi:hypothetical protein